MNVMQDFDDSKLYESIFGENQRWRPGWPGVSAYRPPWNNGWSDMAYSNKEAADHLVDWLVEEVQPRPMSGSNLTFPIMSLYRHYLELTLKDIQIQLQEWEHLDNILSGEYGDRQDPKYNHQLMDIWKRVRELLYKIDASELAIEGVREEIDEKYDAIEQRIQEFHDIDERSTSFRYPVERGGEPALGTPLSNDELLQVKSVVDAFHFYLSGISCGVAETTSALLDELVNKGTLRAEYQ